MGSKSSFPLESFEIVCHTSDETKINHDAYNIIIKPLTFNQVIFRILPLTYKIRKLAHSEVTVKTCFDEKNFYLGVNKKKILFLKLGSNRKIEFSRVLVPINDPIRMEEQFIKDVYSCVDKCSVLTKAKIPLACLQGLLEEDFASPEYHFTPTFNIQFFSECKEYIQDDIPHICVTWSDKEISDDKQIYKIFVDVEEKKKIVRKEVLTKTCEKEEAKKFFAYPSSSHIKIPLDVFARGIQISFFRASI